MKLANTTNKKQGHRSDSQAVIPLIPKKLTETERQQITRKQYKLKVDPDNKDSTNEYKVTIECFSNNLPNAAERLCKMCEEFPTIFKGQGIEEKPNAMHQLVLTILKDEAKTSYENAVRAACEATENGPRIFPTRDIINEGLAKVKELVMPVGARRKQAACLRRHLGKPASMSVASYVHRIQVLSRYLVFFPGSRGSLPEDEVV